MQEQFDVDPKTMKRRANVLKEGMVLAGRSASRKPTEQVRCFARMRFEQIYSICHKKLEDVVFNLVPK